MYSDKCSKCKKEFSLDLIPLELPCCHSYCKTCLEAIIEENHRLYCIADDKTFEINLDKLPISQFYLNYLKTSGMRVFCPTHKNKYIEYMCDKEEEFLCSLCILQHVDHKDKLQIYEEGMMVSDVKILLSKLKESKLKAEDLHSKLELLLEDSNIPVEKLKDMYKIVISFLMKPFCEKIENEQKKPIPFSLSDQNFIDSLALKGCLNTSYLDEIIPKFKSAKRIFRASEYNFKVADFHKKCDNIGPTILLIKSKTNKYFGAYCASAWNSGGNWIAAEGSFLFSLDNKTKHENYQNPGNAMYGNASYGPTFGGNHDLFICDNCFNANSSSSNIGHSYKLTQGANAQTHFAGSNTFYVEEYEVYAF